MSELADPSLRAGKLATRLGAIEDNGMASSSRVHMIWWSVVSTGLWIAIVVHIMRLKDAALLQIWLGALPIITLCLTVLMQSGYAINQGSGAFGVLAEAWGKSKEKA